MKKVIFTTLFLLLALGVSKASAKSTILVSGGAPQEVPGISQALLNAFAANAGSVPQPGSNPWGSSTTSSWPYGSGGASENSPTDWPLPQPASWPVRRALPPDTWPVATTAPAPLPPHTPPTWTLGCVANVTSKGFTSYNPVRIDNGRTQLIGVIGGFPAMSDCQSAIATSAKLNYAATCGFDGAGYMPYWTYSGKRLGERASVSATIDQCNALLQTSQKDMLCAGSDRTGWLIAMLNKFRFSSVIYKTQQQCLDELNNSRNGLTCYMNDYGFYQPVNTTTAQAMGHPYYAWASRSDCEHAVDLSTPNYVCAWADGGYWSARSGFMPYTIATGAYDISKVSDDFMSCYNAILNMN